MSLDRAPADDLHGTGVSVSVVEPELAMLAIVAVGAVLPVQGLVNARLASALHGPVSASPYWARCWGHCCRTITACCSRLAAQTGRGSSAPCWWYSASCWSPHHGREPGCPDRDRNPRIQSRNLLRAQRPATHCAANQRETGHWPCGGRAQASAWVQPCTSIRVGARESTTHVRSAPAPP